MTVSSLTQLRIDFLDFTISQPNSAGFCVNDFLAVTGGASWVPLICGENTNEHGKTLLHVFICPQVFQILIVFLMGYDTVWHGRWIPVLRRNIMCCSEMLVSHLADRMVS
jgi:hypothetical protein